MDSRDLSWSRSVWFTFDDAYESALLNAVPILSTTTFYAVPGLVGKTSKWDEDRARPLADWDLLTEAAQKGFEIGNHTRDHKRLTDIDFEEQTAQIESAKEELKHRGIEPTSLCYPYGGYNSQTILAAKDAGYSVAVALGKRTAKLADDPLCLPRIVVAYSDQLPKLLYKIYLRRYLP